MPLSQLDRSVSAATPLGEDVLLIRRMKGSERLSTPFEYQLELVSEEGDIDHADLLGRPMAIRLNLPDARLCQSTSPDISFSRVKGFDGTAAAGSNCSMVMQCR